MVFKNVTCPPRDRGGAMISAPVPEPVALHATVNLIMHQLADAVSTLLRIAPNNNDINNFRRVHKGAVGVIKILGFYMIISQSHRDFSKVVCRTTDRTSNGTDPFDPPDSSPACTSAAPVGRSLRCGYLGGMFRVLAIFNTTLILWASQAHCTSWFTIILK